MNSRLRSFHAVALEGGFSQAARRLGVTQPAITQQVRALESEYHVRLFQRHRRGVELTEDGRALLELTGSYFALEETIEERLSAMRDLRHGRLRIAADTPFAALPLVRRLREQYAELIIEVSFGNTRQILDRLRAQQADVGILGDPPNDANFEQLWLFQQQLRLLVRHDDPWCEAQPIPLARLSERTILGREQGSRTREIFEASLREAQVNIPPPLVLGSREALKEGVAQGLGVGYVFSAEVGTDARLATLDIANHPGQSQTAFTCLRNQRGRAVVEAAWEIAMAFGTVVPPEAT